MSARVMEVFSIWISELWGTKESNSGHNNNIFTGEPATYKKGPVANAP